MRCPSCSACWPRRSAAGTARSTKCRTGRPQCRLRLRMWPKSSAKRRNAIALETSRDHMLAGIRASLEQSRAQLADMAARTPHAPPPFVHPPQDDLPDQFAAELAKLEGYPHRCADDTQALG